MIGPIHCHGSIGVKADWQIFKNIAILFYLSLKNIDDFAVLNNWIDTDL